VFTGVDEAPRISSPELSVFPNPFNPRTTISYAVDRPGPVSMRIFDVAGRLVDVVFERRFHEPKRYAVSYDAQLPSGVYFLKMEFGSGELTRKMVLMK
jgi:hypothetical protein